MMDLERLWGASRNVMDPGGASARNPGRCLVCCGSGHSVEDCAIALRAIWALRVYDCVTSAGGVPVERGGLY